MIDHPTCRIASPTVADRQNGLIVGPQVAVISGSAHSPRTATIDAPAHTSKKTETSCAPPSIPCSPWPRWWRSRSRSRLRLIARCRSLDRFRDTAFCTSRGEFVAEI
jgi:hypothetical protein